MNRRFQGATGVALLGIALSMVPIRPVAARDDMAVLAVSRTSGPIAIDGDLRDPGWSAATSTSSFAQVEPIEFANPSARSTIWLLFDDDYFYVGARLEQDPGSIVARQLVQGRSVDGDDQITVLIDTFGDESSGYAFTVNPNGVRVDALIDDSDDFNDDWEDIWFAAAAMADDGWSVEIAIPFRTLSFPAGEDAWSINVQRTLAEANETMALVSADRRVDLTTTLPVAGFSDATPGSGIDVVASATLKRFKDFEDNQTTTDFEPSVDVFYKLTPSLTAALTINTDFSAAEVDNREVNLTRFDLFFPERRDFFLQDANVFEFGDIEENGLPFFSRRIGLSEEGDPLPIDGGVKLTGQYEDLRIGFLAVQQRVEAERREETMGVARLQMEVADESALGVIATVGDPVSGRSDSLVGVDYRYQNDEIMEDQELEAFAWWQQVDRHGINDQDSAYGVTIAWPNDTIDAAIAYARIEDNFAPPLGFVNRSGIRDYRSELTWRVRPESDWLRIADFGVDLQWVEDSAGQLETRILEFTPLDLKSHAGDELELGIIRQYERLSEEFEVTDNLAVEPGRYHFNRQFIEFSSASQRAWTAALLYEWGEFFDGDLEAIEASFAVAPNKHWALGIDYEENRLDLSDGKETVRLIRLLGTYAFNARWSWTNLIQYDSESREAGLNSRLRWIPRAGQEGFLIINHGFVRDERNHFRSEESDIALRFSYTFQF